MNNNNINSNDASLSVDLSEATQAVKENRFEDALNLFEIILKDLFDLSEFISFFLLMKNIIM